MIPVSDAADAQRLQREANAVLQIKEFELAVLIASSMESMDSAKQKTERLKREPRSVNH